MSELTELLLCLQSKSLEKLSNLANLTSQLSSHLSLNDIQIDAIFADSIIVLGYLILLTRKMNAARFKILTAFLFTLVVAYSPMYDWLNEVQLFCAYSLIYVAAAYRVSNKKIKYTLVILALFELIMARDAYVNPKVETWVFDNFEEITCLIHALIISSSLKLKPINWRDFMGRLIAAMRGLSHSYCLTSRL